MANFIVNNIGFRRLEDVTGVAISVDEWKDGIKSGKYNWEYGLGRYAKKDLFLNGGSYLYESDMILDFDEDEINAKIDRYGFSHVILYKK